MDSRTSYRIHNVSNLQQSDVDYYSSIYHMDTEGTLNEEALDVLMYMLASEVSYPHDYIPSELAKLVFSFDFSVDPYIREMRDIVYRSKRTPEYMAISSMIRNTKDYQMLWNSMLNGDILDDVLVRRLTRYINDISWSYSLGYSFTEDDVTQSWNKKATEFTPQTDLDISGSVRLAESVALSFTKHDRACAVYYVEMKHLGYPLGSVCIYHNNSHFHQDQMMNILVREGSLKGILPLLAQWLFPEVAKYIPRVNSVIEYSIGDLVQLTGATMIVSSPLDKNKEMLLNYYGYYPGTGPIPYPCTGISLVPDIGDGSPVWIYKEL